MRWLLLLLMLILFGAFFIISNNNLHLADKAELTIFGGLYYSWLNDIFDNVKSVTGYIVKSEWLPENQTVEDTVNIKR